MQERAGSQFDEMAAIVTELNRTLKDSSDGLAQSQRDVQAALSSVMTTVRTSMDAGATAMTETLQQSLGDVTRIMADASHQLAERLTGAGTAAAEAGVEAASQISGSLDGLLAAANSLDRSTRQSEQMLTNMTSFVDQINTLRETIEVAHRQIADVAEPMGRAAGEIRASSDKAAVALGRTSELVGSIDAAVNSLEQHQKTVAGNWDRYRERFEGIDGSLAQVFQKLDEGLSGYCKQVTQFVNELDGTTSKITQDLAGATNELHSSIEDLSEHLRRRA